MLPAFMLLCVFRVHFSCLLQGGGGVESLESWMGWMGWVACVDLLFFPARVLLIQTQTSSSSGDAGLPAFPSTSLPPPLGPRWNRRGACALAGHSTAVGEYIDYSCTQIEVPPCLAVSLF